MRRNTFRLGKYGVLLTLPALLALVSGVVPAQSQPLLTVTDTPDDWGTGLTVTWEEPAYPVTGYEIWRLALDAAERPAPVVPPDTMSASDFLLARGWQLAGESKPGTTEFLDSGLEPSGFYSYVLLVRALPRPLPRSGSY
jgi:hypothetical protein